MSIHRALAIFDRVLMPPLDDLKPAAARALLEMKFNRRDQKRIHELSALARKGTLTESQQDELDLYFSLGNVLTILHSKARVSLRDRGIATASRSQRKTA